MSEQPEGSQEKSRIFRSKTEMQRIQQEIAELKARQTLGRRASQRLEELEGIKRREFLKKAAVGLGGAALLTTAAIKGKETLREFRAEKKEPTLWVKSLIKEYNDWLRSLEANEGEKIDAIGKFIKIYNRSRAQIVAPFELPQLSEDDLRKGNIESFSAKLQPLTEALEHQGYFFTDLPTFGGLEGNAIEVMGLIFGKVVKKADEQARKRADSASYQHIVIDTVNPGESLDSYISTPLDVSALTFQKGGITRVLQYLASYRDSAKNTYHALKQSPTSERDRARDMVFGTYKNIPEKDALTIIQNLYLKTSRSHEEQHVVDKVFPESQSGIPTQEALSRWVVAEIRGLISPLADSDPKVALFNIYTWKASRVPLRGAVADTAESILYDVSSKSLGELLETPDAKLNTIGIRAMGATDILYDFVSKKGMPLGDPTIQEKFDQYMKELPKGF